jgi:outer membrane biosynthesis protein TonB
MGLSTQQWINLIVIALIVGFSALSWLARKLQEQAARKRALEEIERRREEMLRTGKDPAVLVAGPALSEQEARLREIAARRQAQLQELRRRAQMRQQSGGPVSVRTTPPPTPPRVATPPVPAPSPRPSSATRPPQAPGRPASRPPAKPVPEPVRRPRPAPVETRSRPSPPPSRPAASRVVEGESHAERLVPDVPIEPPKPRVVLRWFTPPRSAAEWRRAVVLHEILSLPVAFRGR